ncbi:MAG: glycosyltransferase family 4 protein [bacterium]|nr:glycosyltransferase family 4 protein [bacterium]
MKILLLTRYDRMGASTRLRSLQYLPYLQSFGWEIDAIPFFSQVYLQDLYKGRSTWTHVLLAYVQRFKALIDVGKYELVWIEKEAVPFFPPVAERLLKTLRIPYVVDYDDALFHRYGLHRLWPVRAVLGRKIDIVMRYASVVTAGNEYLADWARNAGASRIEIIPTVIDLNRYPVSESRNEASKSPLVVGWIGTPKTSRYLHTLESVFASLQSQLAVRFVAVGAGRESLGDLPFESWPWTEDTEVSSIKLFDIGIMPLDDSPWARGKCGYKLIQYMACCLPVVASPVGVNRKIVKVGKNGFLPETACEWGEALMQLLNDADLRQRMGRHGRRMVESTYCLQVVGPRLAQILRNAI